jgi:L-2-hydroxyglutarate oxidase
MTTNVDVIVIGGGIVGCATALRLLHTRPGTRLAILEKEAALAQHQTGHNSGVIHSGLYYKPGSLKARNCREGYVQLLDFCRREGIPHEICGKVVVATSQAELPRLDELHRRGQANGLQGLRRLGPAEIRKIEPHCTGVAGLLVPETGIIDYGTLARKYSEKILELGANISLNEEIIDLRAQKGRVEVVGKNQSWTTRVAVVCAGLQSDRLARMTEPELPLRILPFRGEYYKLKQSAPHLVNHLIYPVPDPAFPFLGVHFTRMIGGGVECGPNAVFAFGREAYRKTDFNLRDTWEALTWPGFRKVAGRYWRTGLGEFHRSISKKAFVSALQKLIPEIQTDYLEPGGAGIRAQACDREGHLLDDFDIRISGNVIHVCNAPSPAATASLAIGQSLADKILSLWR